MIRHASLRTTCSPLTPTSLTLPVDHTKSWLIVNQLLPLYESLLWSHKSKLPPHFFSLLVAAGEASAVNRYTVHASVLCVIGLYHFNGWISAKAEEK